MSQDFLLPDLGEGIHEAEIIAIKVKVGQSVKEDDILFEVETDKAVVEVPSPFTGTVEAIHVKEGETAKTGCNMITIGSGSGDAKAPAKEEKKAEKVADTKTQILTPVGKASEANGGNGKTAPAPTAAPAQTAANSQSPAHHVNRDIPVPAAPAVRALARELKVDLYDVRPSGPHGRVMKEDVRSYAAGALESRVGSGSGSGSSSAVATSLRPAQPAISLHDKYGGGDDKADKTSGGSSMPSMQSTPSNLPDFSKQGEVERVPLRSIRKKIAQAMMKSWTTIPHVTTFDEADITGLNATLKSAEKSFAEKTGSRLTLTAVVIKAVVSALQKYPQFNSSLDDEKSEIIFKKYYNIGIAVATEKGLIVPVIHNADQKSLTQIAIELQDIANKTRAGKVELEKLQGGTFTITNIGAIGGTNMSPMINHPECAILGMARGADKPIVRNGNIEIGTILPLALSFDHRLADGAEAAYFVRHIINHLEHPLNFILEN
ncbi:MAG: 2-oxo acid dehydrogenase subunit E2 [Candidatus Melainabacteria bacterium]|nr:MAG: 2-oxo acid dehydrogenase subunit E2 [Candidatus Melainabacteria bacterium]